MRVKYPWVPALAAVALCGLLCASCGTLKGGAGPGGGFRYQPRDSENKKITYMGSVRSELSRRPSEKGIKSPVAFSKQAMYGSIELGQGDDTTYTFLFDETHGTGSGVDTLYFDANNNEDLTDDPPIVGEDWDNPNSYTTTFGPVEAQVDANGVQHVLRLKVRHSHYSSPSASLTPDGYYVGKARVGDREIGVALFDDSTNGRFDDVFALPDNISRTGNLYAKGDALVLDLNGDGVFEKDYYDAPELHHLGKYLPWGDVCYEVAIKPDGTGLTLTPTTAPCGTVNVDTPGLSMELFGDNGPMKIRSDLGATRVPAGEYRVYQCSIDAKDDNGRMWRAIARGQWEADAITVSEGQAVNVAVGPPFVTEVTYERKSANEYEFELAIHGQAGEEYTAGNINRLGLKSRAPAPKVKVVDKDGNTVAQGNFEYG